MNNEIKKKKNEENERKYQQFLLNYDYYDYKI